MIKNEHLHYWILATGIIGYFILIYSLGWLAAGGIFTVHWSINLSRRRDNIDMLQEWAAGISDALKNEPL